ncbi:hypothetical protein [uncultured Desulfosarcina sp.]|uniref:hypothetical protein n=1 Tax=uncultured Desulfosarcina sp. TaxID=218289 RepID=UPI0029C8CEE0|nr:hypothetical protein [uncultured Desulfosarcina sp.]
MRTATMMLAVWLCLSAAGGAGYAETARDPFENTPSADIPLNYEQAIHQFFVKGIVRTKAAKRIIVSIAGIDGLAVLKPGDKLSLDCQGRPHVFRVATIEAKTVGFQTVPPASAGGQHAVQTYEVIVR